MATVSRALERSRPHLVLIALMQTILLCGWQGQHMVAQIQAGVLDMEHNQFENYV
jgi:hypothetical protein